MLNLSAVAKKEKVLIVDDSTELNLVYQQLLKSEGYDVLLNSDGQSGLNTIRDQGSQIGLVLLDCFMPTMSGEEFIEHLKKQDPEFYENTLIYAVSCLSEDSPQAQRIASQVDGFLEKPDSFDGIINFVKAQIPR